MNFGGIFDLAQKQARVDELDALGAAPDFWDDADRAQALMKERGECADLVATFNSQEEALAEAELYVEMAAEEGNDEGLVEAAELLDTVESQVAIMEIERMFGGEHDGSAAFLSINSGAGGTDSQDWAEMLMRMYTRYCQQKGWKIDINDQQAGQEAGIKSVDLHISGRNVYGHLKAESGVHRLVRISPYGKKRRETSFAAVKVVPEIDDNIDIEINDSDLRIDTYRSSGAGGQHVNTTDSAVRITHIPTNVVVQCQNERSQIKNRATAMKMLKAKLYDLELQAREDAANSTYNAENDVAFGSQIRSYVLHPYKQIKDLRSGFTVSNVDRVLDGDLDGFVEAFLLLDGGESNQIVDDA